MEYLTVDESLRRGRSRRRWQNELDTSFEMTEADHE
jgi:hypothetical protein